MFKFHDLDECGYSFLYDNSSLVDWEVLTDGFSNKVGRSICETEIKIDETTDDNIRKNLEEIERTLRSIQIIILNSNPSVRKESVITEEVLNSVKKDYIYYKDKYDGSKLTKNGFVLPLGSRLTMELHECRSCSKECVRQLVSMDNEGKYQIPEYIPRLFSTLPNLFFILALAVNSLDSRDEEVYESLHYKLR